LPKKKGAGPEKAWPLSSLLFFFFFFFFFF